VERHESPTSPARRFSNRPVCLIHGRLKAPWPVAAVSLGFLPAFRNVYGADPVIPTNRSLISGLHEIPIGIARMS
jgi:hypothetical protein